MPHLSLSLLGPLEVTLEGRPVKGLESNKVRALLAYLVAEAHRPHYRISLAELLWPERPEAAALVNLRRALYNLRQVTADAQARPPFLLVSRETIQFNQDSDFWCDLRVFQQLISAEATPSPDPLQRAAQLYRGPFLEGLTIGGSFLFEEWLLLRREQIDRQLAAILSRLAGHYEGQGDYEQAIASSEQWLRLEPWEEQAHRQLMRLLAWTGRRNAALAHYQRCCHLFAEEFAVEPEPATTQLYEAIRQGAFTRDPVNRKSALHLPVRPPDSGVGAKGSLFVGREQEMARLEELLAAALAGEGQVAFVLGEAGQGKTALLREFARRAMERHGDLLAASGSCRTYHGQGDPYHPFREILALLASGTETRPPGGDPTPEQSARLWDALPWIAQTLVDQGPDLVGRFVSAEPLLLRVEASAGITVSLRNRLADLVKQRSVIPHASKVDQDTPGIPHLFEQVDQVLRSLARRAPLLLLLDNMQWSDGSTVDLLFYLSRRLSNSRILIVGAYRPTDVALGRQGQRHPLEPVVHEFQRRWGDILVELDQAEARPFCDALLDSEPNVLGESFRRTLCQHTGGNPLFTIEMLHLLQESGGLVKDRGGCWAEGATLDWGQLPARVEAVIAERIDRLPAEWQAALDVASVEGETFTAEIVARVLGVDEADLLRDLSTALSKRHRLVYAAGRRGLAKGYLSCYRFRHPLFQRYLYRRLDDLERAKLHQAIGNELEALRQQLRD